MQLAVLTENFTFEAGELWGGEHGAELSRCKGPQIGAAWCAPGSEGAEERRGEPRGGEWQATRCLGDS